MLKDLTYKVIVIDDEEDLYEDYVEYIQEKLKDEGYILTHQRYEELTELEENPIEDVDLFLVDLKFGKEDKGPDFIRKIRENLLTDILFYSSDRDSIHNNRVSGEYQGVFFAVRDENTNEIFNWIDQLVGKMIKRSNTPLSSRGIVLGCVAELDNIVKIKVKDLLTKITPEQREKIITECLEMYFKSYKGQSDKLNAFWGFDFHDGIKKWADVKSNNPQIDLCELVNNIRITDSNKNFRVLLKTYASINGEDDTYSIIKNFVNLLDDRNIFAHVQEELDEDNNYRFKRFNKDEYLVLTTEKCKELRIPLVDYWMHISKL